MCLYVCVYVCFTEHPPLGSSPFCIPLPDHKTQLKIPACIWVVEKRQKAKAKHPNNLPGNGGGAQSLVTTPFISSMTQRMGSPVVKA